jgi:hypothetical protein
MLLDRPLGQPEDLLIALPGMPLVPPGQEQKVAPLRTPPIQNHLDAAPTFMEGHDGNTLNLLEHLTLTRRLIITEAEDISPRRRPAILGSQDKPRLLLLDNLEAVGEALVSALLENPDSLSHHLRYPERNFRLPACFSQAAVIYFLPMRDTLVPQTGQTPCVAGRPFFKVTALGFLISLFARHFMQYASISRLLSPLGLQRRVAEQ